MKLSSSLLLRAQSDGSDIHMFLHGYKFRLGAITFIRGTTIKSPVRTMGGIIWPVSVSECVWGYVRNWMFYRKKRALAIVSVVRYLGDTIKSISSITQIA